MKPKKPPKALLRCGFAAALLFSSCGGKPPPDSGAGDERRNFCEEVNKPFFAETVKGSGRYSPQRERAQPAAFIMPKPAGIKRVFVVGESVAAMLDRGEMALYGGWLGHRLSAAGILPRNANDSIEIINCGMGGYEINRVYGVMKEVLRYSPDLIVVLSGNNREGIDEAPCPGTVFELRRRKLRLYQRYYSLKASPRQALAKAYLKAFSGVMDEMAAEAKKAGVPIVFCTLPVNVADIPARQPLPFGVQHFSSGYKLFYEKKYKPALEEFRAGLNSDPDSHFLNFYSGKALEVLGKGSEAAPYFFKALESGGRATPSLNAEIRRTAAADGACVADLEKFIYALSPGGTPGFGQFTDSMHWRPQYNRAVWDEIFRSATACGIKGYEKFQAADYKGWKETTHRDAVKRLNYAVTWLSGRGLSDAALAEFSYIRAKDPELLEEAAASPDRLGKLVLHESRSMGSLVSAIAVYPLFLEHLAETERRRGNYPGAMALCERAMALKPGDRDFRLLRAQILAGGGRTAEALREFSQLAADGTFQEARGLWLAYAPGSAVPAKPVTAAHPAAAVPAAPPAAAVPAAPAASLKARGPHTKVVRKKHESMDLCFGDAVSAAEKTKALQACQQVSYLAGSGELSGGGALASDASLRSCALLEALGRTEEAGETLVWTIKTAPAGWGGLPAAEKLAVKLGITQ